MKFAKIFAALVCVAIPTISAQTQAQGQDQAAPAMATSSSKAADIMGQTQWRHFKLWFAGSLGNWELANYEVGQIGDSFDTAAKLNPTIGNIPFAQLLSRESAPPLADIGKAIAARNGKDFVRAFERLTAACNSCHAAANVGFIMIRVPTSSPFSDQSFPPERK
jgi:hypothetical protein